MKKIFKEHSPYLLFLCVMEIIITIISIEAFVYSDSLNYSDSLIYSAIGIEKLLETMYSSTWWAFILFTLGFITIMTLTSIVYKKLEYLFISIMGWILMLLLAINIGIHSNYCFKYYCLSHRKRKTKKKKTLIKASI